MFGLSLEVNERTPLASVDPVGQLEAAEHIVISYEVDGSMEIYRPSQKSLKAVGLFPRTANPRDILSFDGITVEVQDRIDNVTLERLRDFHLEEVSRSYRKGTLTVYNCRYKATIVTDEAEN